MPGKSQNPGKRRKYRRSSILCHSHPSVPEAIPDSPISQTTGTPASRLFDTPGCDGPYTPASAFSPSPLRNKQKASQSTESETPICDALVRAGIIPDRGPVRPWPNDPVLGKPGWKVPCEMNGIHEAMNRILFKQELIRAADEAERQRALEKQFPGARFTNSASK
ncbi:hypothetical protein LTR84_007064 [Exophiala bonariae]|uniref:Uncharacterized protein n=1 Tax=Exophiala bonariae TaxID=1690606 RepID=A0AAV9MZK5_9EURO|nr:hypothetical protein LTR84_007064 [Exophiala bonariae]